MRTTHWFLMAVLAFGLACSRDEARDAAEDARDAARSAQEAAGEAADAAAAKTKEAAGAMRDSAAAAVESGTKTIAESEAAAEAAIGLDSVSRCTELAAKEKWVEALEPCTDAHAKRPNDMAIEHALQQARAAAAQ